MKVEEKVKKLKEIYMFLRRMSQICETKRNLNKLFDKTKITYNLDDCEIIDDTTLLIKDDKASSKIVLDDNEIMIETKDKEVTNVKRLIKSEGNNTIQIIDVNKKHVIKHINKDTIEGSKEMEFNIEVLKDNKENTTIEGINKYDYIEYPDKNKVIKTGEINSEILIDQDNYLFKLVEVLKTDGGMKAYVKKKDNSDKYKEVLYDSVIEYLYFNGSINDVYNSSKLIEKPKVRKY